MNITICGPQGCGKTTLAHKMALWLVDQGFNVDLREGGEKMRLIGMHPLADQPTIVLDTGNCVDMGRGLEP